MIELPEAYTIARQLKKTIFNKKVSNIMINHSPHKFAFFSGDDNYYNALLKNKKITDIVERNFYVEIRIEDSTLLFRDGINLRYHDNISTVPSKHQFLMEFEDHTYLSATISMYGFIYGFKDNFDDKYYNLEVNGLSPLSNNFDLDYFNGLIDDNTKKLSSKAFLATEQRILGIGNGVVQDILFNAYINPKRKINTMNNNDITILFNSIKITLKDMDNNGGRDTEKDLFGNNGQYQTVMSKNNANKPCPKCGTLIKKENYLGGSIYYCPSCQK